MGRPFDKQVLREALRAHYPWLDREDLGPRAVEAGECDHCGNEARLVPTCGSTPYRALGRRCALRLGLESWCAGHGEDAQEALDWLRSLPREADDVARLWWVATGEARLDLALVSRSPALAEVVAGVLEDPSG
ncbi:MAG: hypothetical protein M3N32_11910 [Actinomycetota bacterium]|nr:hypothetical protein [Actinomycetota bacterium]